MRGAVEPLLRRGGPAFGVAESLDRSIPRSDARVSGVAGPAEQGAPVQDDVARGGARAASGGFPLRQARMLYRLGQAIFCLPTALAAIFAELQA